MLISKPDTKRKFNDFYIYIWSKKDQNIEQYVFIDIDAPKDI